MTATLPGARPDTDLASMPEPPDGTRLAVLVRPSSGWCHSCDRTWLVIWRDDAYGRSNWIVPDGESTWISDAFDPTPWHEVASEIVEAYELTPAWSRAGAAQNGATP